MEDGELHAGRQHSLVLPRSAPVLGLLDRCSSPTKQLVNDDDPWGHVLYAMRGTTGTVDFASRIRDSSRQSLSAASGTEVPIVREGDFRGQLRLRDLPVDGRYRTILRMWSLGDFPEYVVVVDSTPARCRSTPRGSRARRCGSAPSTLVSRPAIHDRPTTIRPTSP